MQLSGDSAIEFASGPITSLAANAQLGLNGTDAFIEDSAALGSNSALTGLASIGAGASFGLANGASVSTTAASLDNAGSLNLSNGAELSTTGALVNDGIVNLNGGGSSLTLTGTLTNSAGTTFDLENGASVSTGSQVNDGRVDLQNSASMSMTGGLVNNGLVYLDYASNGSGSTLAVDGALTNTGGIFMGTSFFPVASDTLTADTLSNSGTIYLQDVALLDVTTGAAGFGTTGTLTGNVTVRGHSAIEFKSGQISTIATGASLTMLSFSRGVNPFIEDSTALGSNSALTGLTDIAGSLLLQSTSLSTTGPLTDSGSLDLENGASLSTTGSVTNSGVLSLDTYYGVGGSTLSIGGGLTNTGTLDIGAIAAFSPGPSASVTAKSFVNSGTVTMAGKGATILAALNVSGATTNNGAIDIFTDTEELAGAVDGAKGSFSLSMANLQFDSSVSSGQTINETGADALTLKQAQSFAGTISGFGTGDTIDATNFVKSGTTFDFVENSAMTGGTLTLTDTSSSLTANIQMTGVYTKSEFTLAPDSGTGTLVKFV